MSWKYREVIEFLSLFFVVFEDFGVYDVGSDIGFGDRVIVFLSKVFFYFSEIYWFE